MNFNLKKIGSFLSSENVIYPFSLQSCGNLLTHLSKTSCSVLTLSGYQNITPTKMILTASKTRKPKDYIQLNVNKMKVFYDADEQQKNYLMLHPYLLPDCTLKNTHYLKSEISPCSLQTGYILACLTTAGIIELYTYNIDQSELDKIDVSLTDMRINALNKASTDIVKFDVLLSSYNEIAFINFEWWINQKNDSLILVGVTKSNEMLMFEISGDTNEITVEEVKSTTIEDISKGKLKMLELNGENFLILTTAKGTLTRYRIDVDIKGTVTDITKVDSTEGKCKMPTSFIAIDHCGTFALVICCKGHTLEIFKVTSDAVSLVLSRYIDITITGISVVENLEYLICTLNSVVYYVKLDEQISLELCEKLEVTSAEDEEQISFHSLYGIAKSKNNVLVFISCYPQQPFDHLVNKQPDHISINLFTKYDPLQILISNPSLKLTEYADCIEAVRYLALGNFEMLQDLEAMDYDISINNQFLYYLKIQLLVISIKLVYYQMKSQNIYKIIKETKDSIKQLILVINGNMILNTMLQSKELTQTHYAVFKSLMKFIKNYCDTKVEKEPFRSALNILTPLILEILRTCEENIDMKQLRLETCSVCQESIDDQALECSSNHKVKRCVMTYMVLPLDSSNHCKQCKETVAPLDTLQLIDPSENMLLCPLCDLKLIINE